MKYILTSRFVRSLATLLLNVKYPLTLYTSKLVDFPYNRLKLVANVVALTKECVRSCRTTVECDQEKALVLSIVTAN